MLTVTGPVYMPPETENDGCNSVSVGEPAVVLAAPGVGTAKKYSGPEPSGWRPIDVSRATAMEGNASARVPSGRVSRIGSPEALIAKLVCTCGPLGRFLPLAHTSKR